MALQQIYHATKTPASLSDSFRHVSDLCLKQMALNHSVQISHMHMTERFEGNLGHLYRDQQVKLLFYGKKNNKSILSFLKVFK